MALAMAWSFFVGQDSYFGSKFLGLLLILTVMAPLVAISACVIAFLQYKKGASDALFYIVCAAASVYIGFPFLQVWFYSVVGFFVG